MNTVIFVVHVCRFKYPIRDVSCDKLLQRQNRIEIKLYVCWFYVLWINKQNLHISSSEHEFRHIMIQKIDLIIPHVPRYNMRLHGILTIDIWMHLYHKPEKTAKLKILEESQIVCSTLNGSAYDELRKIDFSCVIVDEAAQCIEPDILIPLQHRYWPHKREFCRISGNVSSWIMKTYLACNFMCNRYKCALVVSSYQYIESITQNIWQGIWLHILQ